MIAVSQMMPLGSLGSSPSYVCFAHAWGSVGGDYLIPDSCGTNLDHKKSTKKMAKAINRSPAIQAVQLTVLFMGGAMWLQKQPHTSSVSVW
jgi:hypothetical protein